jgi:hypothetical protein
MSPKPQTYNHASQLLASQDFFNRSTRVLEETDSQFRPHEGMMTVAQQVAHAAQTLDWFIQGASRAEGLSNSSIPTVRRNSRCRCRQAQSWVASRSPISYGLWWSIRRTIAAR